MTASEVIKGLRAARVPKSPGAILAHRSLLLEAAALLEADVPRAGEPHAVDRAFSELAVKERDYERVRADRFKRERDRLKSDGSYPACGSRVLHDA